MAGEASAASRFAQFSQANPVRRRKKNALMMPYPYPRHQSICDLLRLERMTALWAQNVESPDSPDPCRLLPVTSNCSHQNVRRWQGLALISRGFSHPIGQPTETPPAGSGALFSNVIAGWCEAIVNISPLPMLRRRPSFLRPGVKAKPPCHACTVLFFFYLGLRCLALRPPALVSSFAAELAPRLATANKMQEQEQKPALGCPVLQ